MDRVHCRQARDSGSIHDSQFTVVPKRSGSAQWPHGHHQRGGRAPYFCMHMLSFWAYAYVYFPGNPRDVWKKGRMGKPFLPVSLFSVLGGASIDSLVSSFSWQAFFNLAFVPPLVTYTVAGCSAAVCLLFLRFIRPSIMSNSLHIYVSADFFRVSHVPLN